MDLLLTILLLLSESKPYQPKPDICTLNTDHLGYREKIHFYIGCSTVDGRRVYTDSSLREIYGEVPR